MKDSKRGWHSRGYLPHYDGDRFQFVTFRLADSLPQSILDKFRSETSSNKLDQYYDRAFQIKIEEYLDQGVGECWLMQPRVADALTDVLLYFHHVRYLLAAWVIMPNHVHLLLLPLPGFHFQI